MGTYSDIDAIFDDIRNRITRLGNRILQAMNDETSKAMDDAMVEFGIFQQNYISNVFSSAVSSFYDSYTPGIYKRTNGLFDVLDLKVDDNGMVISYSNDYMDMFNEEKMHKGRSGNDLFQKVFVSGYHGGAENPYDGGTLCYRAPGLYRPENGDKPYWYRYGKWGRPAVRTKSAYEMFVEDMRSAEGGEMLDAFKSISQKHNDMAIDRVVKMIPRLEAEIFS